MPLLSVNINKIATLRNARGGNIPNVPQASIDCEAFGAQGITVHPRPDERHIRYEDVYNIAPIIETEFNIEGYPTEPFLSMVEQIKPDQVTLVPDSPEVLTSNAGWNVKANFSFLQEVVSRLKEGGMRVSIFMDTDVSQYEWVKKVETDRIELYTEAYASGYSKNREEAIKPYVKAAKLTEELEIGINAGHDLNLQNLRFFQESIPNLLEVSIGHALISDALYFGLENTIQMYLRELRR